MDNLQLAQLWQKTADLLEIMGENPHRAAAYRRGARNISKSPLSLGDLHATGQLEKIPGIGPSLKANVLEFLATGTLTLYHELEAQVGDDLMNLVSLGISPRLVGRLHRELGIENLGELEAAIKKRQVRTMPQMGPKGELELKRAVARARDGLAFPGPIAESLAQELCDLLGELPQIENVAIAGAIRRGEELAVEAELVVATTLSKLELAEYLSGLPNVAKIKREKLTLELRGGLAVKITATTKEAFFRTLWQETGPEEHLKLVEELGELPADPQSEEKLYLSVDLPWIPPQNRWGTDEVALARRGALPQPLEPALFRGDFHVHSNWSDGIHTLAQLQAKGQALGYEYLAICDHSRTLGIAGGLSVERLQARNQEIEKLNQNGGCKLLRGIELEIGGEGQLDYPPEVLSELDLVVGAIHRGFGQPQGKIMERLERALSTGAIFILAHPTGRLLGRRDALAVDMEKLFKLASKYQVALELNANPDRLDLGADNLRAAKARGIPIAINTDAHSRDNLGQIHWALKVAGRAGLVPEDILNTYSLKSIQKRIEKQKGGG